MAMGARQQVKILETGQLSCHCIAEISLNVMLNQNQPTNHLGKNWSFPAASASEISKYSK